MRVKTKALILNLVVFGVLFVFFRIGKFLCAQILGKRGGAMGEVPMEKSTQKVLITS
jgi:hypothetical protein